MTKLKSGKFIVIEGTDGSGKTTQLQLLQTRLKREGYKVTIFDFPRYDHKSSYFVREYLAGNYGTEIDAYKASIFYALDRFQASREIEHELELGKIVLCNRYVGSNMAHQGSKINSEPKLIEYLKWVQKLEYDTLSIAKPDHNVVLQLPAKIAFDLVTKRGVRQHKKGEASDVLHENNLKHLERTEQTYLYLCNLFPKSFNLIKCTQNNKLLTINQIHKKVWDYVQSILES